MNLSNASAITTPAAMQMMLTMAEPGVAKLDTGMIMTVAAMTMPIMPTMRIRMITGIMTPTRKSRAAMPMRRTPKKKKTVPREAAEQTVKKITTKEFC